MSAVAQVILEQLGGPGRLVAMTGARHVLTEDRAVGFKLPRSSGNPWNYVRIELNDLDLYDIEFAKLDRWGERARTTGLTNVCASQLREVFEAETGLYLSL